VKNRGEIMNRNDFPMLNKDLIYFDNAATTFKPQIVIDRINKYYINQSVNINRSDYDLSQELSTEIEKIRTQVKNFIHAEDSKEIIFTSGGTHSLNMVVFGFCASYLKPGDEVLTTETEHASLVLPFFELAETNQIKVNYIDLDKNNEVVLENVKKAITPKTKVIALAHITNVIGDVRPLQEIIEYAHLHNILVIIDGAQSISHLKVDVKQLDVDFYAFSGHKMMGPTGIGILYGKYNLLEQMKPLILGGGVSATFQKEGQYLLKNIPEKFEAGTQNLSGILGLGSAIEYLEKNRDEVYLQKLKKYALSKMKEISQIKIYNEYSKGPIIIFNVNNVFSQDTAIYLSKKKIAIRSGNHCAKLLNNLGLNNTCRLSLYFYNTKEEIDSLIKALNNENILEESL